jgi:septum formation protein
VLDADTIVVLDDEIMGKPSSSADAVAMLSRLSGRSHRVIGICLMREHTGVEERRYVETKVFMKALTSGDIQGYVNAGEPMDKAGAYGIGGCLVQRIKDSYSNVVGLSLCEVVELLRSRKVADPFGPDIS